MGLTERMTRFIRTDKGLVNLDHVALIENHETDEESSSVLSVTLGSEVLRARAEEFHRSTVVSGPIVPAQPGYFTIDVDIDEEDGSPQVTKIPVVAWYLDEYGYLCPLNSFSSYNTEPVLYPDGRVYEAVGEIWVSEEAYVADRLQEVAVDELERGRISVEIAARYLSAELIESIQKAQAEADAQCADDSEE